MEDINSDCVIVLGICKCCLQDESLTGLWEQHISAGKPEIYGQMIAECFSLPWQQPQNEEEYQEQICRGCVVKLQDAYSFKQSILETQKILLEQIVKREVIEENEDVGDAWELDPADGTFKTEVVVEEEVPKKNYKRNKENTQETGHFEDVEFLEDVEEFIEGHAEIRTKEEPNDAGALSFMVEELNDDPDNDLTPDVDEETSKSPGPLLTERKRKWPKKKKKNELTKMYKQYTQIDLQKAMDAIKSKRMSRLEASEFYNIPKKTLAHKLVHESKQTNKDKGVRTHHLKLVDEIKTILTYTNATPFKTKTGRYHCAYCGTDGPRFEDPDDLRAHTRTKHADERTKHVEHIMRPPWANEVLKLDIEGLHCTVCCVIITAWPTLFTHMQEKHGIEFEEAQNKVIPHLLRRELLCVLCGGLFPSYHHLDGHMNQHYSSYVCTVCGDTFLAEVRLKKHLEVHKTGKYPCEVCGKVYTLEKYKIKHYNHVHKQERSLKCMYCSEKFNLPFHRHLHVLKVHKTKVETITCEMCGKVFTWQPYYLVHLRRKHSSERHYKCKYCDKRFLKRCELKAHMVKHTREKNYGCAECDKKFGNRPLLIRHLKMHANEMNFKRP